MLETFLAMLEKGNDNALVRYSIGNAYFGESNYQDALEHLQSAVEHDRNYSAAWKLLGRCHYELGHFENAIEAYTSGIAIAAVQGDKQAEKEMTVFKRRAEKALIRDT